MALRQGSASNLVKAVQGHRQASARQQDKASWQGSAKHLGKAVQGTYATQCMALRQGSAGHRVNVVQGT